MKNSPDKYDVYNFPSAQRTDRIQCGEAWFKYKLRVAGKILTKSTFFRSFGNVRCLENGGRMTVFPAYHRPSDNVGLIVVSHQSFKDNVVLFMHMKYWCSGLFFRSYIFFVSICKHVRIFKETFSCVTCHCVRYPLNDTWFAPFYIFFYIRYRLVTGDAHVKTTTPGRSWVMLGESFIRP